MILKFTFLKRWKNCFLENALLIFIRVERAVLIALFLAVDCNTYYEHASI